MVKISGIFAWKLLKISIFWQILPKDDHSQANLQKMAGETSILPPPLPHPPSSYMHVTNMESVNSQAECLIFLQSSAKLAYIAVYLLLPHLKW